MATFENFTVRTRKTVTKSTQYLLAPPQKQHTSLKGKFEVWTDWTRLLRKDLNTAFPEQRIAGLRPAYPRATQSRPSAGIPRATHCSTACIPRATQSRPSAGTPRATHRRPLACIPRATHDSYRYLRVHPSSGSSSACSCYKFGRTSHCRVEV